MPSEPSKDLLGLPNPHPGRDYEVECLCPELTQEGGFHEDVTNRVLDDLVRCLEPRRLSVVSVWNVRGGITTTVRVAYPPVQMIDSPRPRV
jgi:7-cyano-7-deazaguanine reductase